MSFQVLFVYCMFILIESTESSNFSEPIINLSKCGLTRVRSVPLARILGGFPINIRESPWMVSLQKIKKKKFEHFCGGSVINTKWILTAAHCLQGVKHSIKKVRIVLGSTQLNESDGQIHEVDKLLIHEKYESFNYHNDIAMVKTTSDINFERNSKKFKVNSLCLNTNNTRAIESAKIYGWGLMTENGNRSDGLMKTTLNQFDHKKCSAIYEEYIGDLSPHMICYWDKDKDACQGDSGGPLTQYIEGREHQIGIVSFGLGCGREDTPGIYTKVSEYIDWITSTILNN